MSEEEAAIRKDERQRLAQLLEDNAPTLTTSAGDKASLIGMIALLLRLDISA